MHWTGFESREPGAWSGERVAYRVAGVGNRCLDATVADWVANSSNYFCLGSKGGELATAKPRLESGEISAGLRANLSGWQTGNLTSKPTPAAWLETYSYGE